MFILSDVGNRQMRESLIEFQETIIISKDQKAKCLLKL